MSIPFYDLNSFPILITIKIDIAVAITVFFRWISKKFNSPLNKCLQKGKKTLINNQKELNGKLEKIKQYLKNLWN